PAARRHLGEVLEDAVLRLQSEADVVASFHPAGGVRHAEHVLGRALRDATLAVAAETAEREARTSVIQRIGAAREIPQSDVGHPVPLVEPARRVEATGIVLAEAGFV